MNDLFEAITTEKTKPTAIDLFAGAGGFSLGVEMAGFDVRAAVEFEHDAAETYRRNRKHAKVLEEDIRYITGERLMRVAEIKKGELDLLFGGPPCQGYTTVNVNRSIEGVY
jgi:DNA (cytosine-5)-methyltransferase 1